MAIEARDVMKEAHPIPNRIAVHPLSDFGHDSCGLVAVDPRAGQQVILDLLQVSVADAASLDPDEQFAGTNRRHGDRLGNDTLPAAVDRGSH